MGSMKWLRLLIFLTAFGCPTLGSADENKFVGRWRPAIAQDGSPGFAPKATALAFELTETSITGRDGTFPVEYDDDGITAHLYVGQIYETTCVLSSDDDDSMICSAMGGIIQTKFVRAGTTIPDVVPK
jgi:hypothetical protein